MIKDNYNIHISIEGIRILSEKAGKEGLFVYEYIENLHHDITHDNKI